VMEGKQILNSQGEVVGAKSTEVVVDFLEPCPLPFFGDMKVEVRQGSGAQDDKLFHFWFNACMLEGSKLVLRKWQLDGVAKDRKHKKYSPHFRMELSFADVATGASEHTAVALD
jgi:hypothetical protein